MSDLDRSHPAPAGGEAHWRELLRHLGCEIAVPLTRAIERVTELQATGRIDRAGLAALRAELEAVRQAGMTGQQLARLGGGLGLHARERVRLGQMLQGVIAQRPDAVAARARVAADARPLEVLADPALLAALLDALLDWALAHAEGVIEWQVSQSPAGVEGASGPVRLACRFARRSGTRGSPRPPERLDTLGWQLVRQCAWGLGLHLERQDDRARVVLGLGFPALESEALEGVSAVELGPHPVLPTRSLAGQQVLVVAARREVRAAVREALRPLGLVVDYVKSLADAIEFCADARPQAVVYETGFEGERLRQWREALASGGAPLVFVEIEAEGSAFEMSGFGGLGPARIGREAIADSLASALVFEWSKLG